MIVVRLVRTSFNFHSIPSFLIKMGPKFYCVVQNFNNSSKLEKAAASTLRVVDCNKWEWWPFQPQHDKDYKKNAYYGLLNEATDQIELVRIVFMSGEVTNLPCLCAGAYQCMCVVLPYEKCY